MAKSMKDSFWNIDKNTIETIQQINTILMMTICPSLSERLPHRKRPSILHAAKILTKREAVDEV